MFRKTAAYSQKRRPKRPDYRLPQGAGSLEVKAHALSRQAYVYEPDENVSDAMSAGRRQTKAMRGGQSHYADPVFADESFQSYARIVKPAAAENSRADNTRTRVARIEPERRATMPPSAQRPAQRTSRAIDHPPASPEIKRRGIIRRQNAARDTVDEQRQYESPRRTTVSDYEEVRSTVAEPCIRATQNHAGDQSDLPGASKRAQMREKPNDSVITSRVQAAKARDTQNGASADYQKNMVTRVRSDGSTLITRAQSAEARMMAAAARRVAVQEGGDDRFAQPQSRMQRKMDKQRSIKAKKAVTRRSAFSAQSEARNPRQANISRRIIILGGVGLAAVIAALVFMFAQGAAPPAFQNPQLTSAIAIIGSPEETETTGAFPVGNESPQSTLSADIPVANDTAAPTNTPASTPHPSATASASPTKTPAPTVTPRPKATPTPRPTTTPTPKPTATPTPRPTATPTPRPTATPTPQPTATPTPQPTATPTPQPTATLTPEPTTEVTPTPEG